MNPLLPRIRRTAAVACAAVLGMGPALAAAGQGSGVSRGSGGGRGGSARPANHGPVNTPPALPYYHGQVVRVPHYTQPAQGQQRFVMPAPTHQYRPQPYQPYQPNRPEPARPGPQAVPSHPPAPSPDPTRGMSFPHSAPRPPVMQIGPAAGGAPAAARPAPPGAAGVARVGNAPPRPFAVFQSPKVGWNGKPIAAQPVQNLARSADFSRQTISNPNLFKNVQNVAQAKGDRDGAFHWYKQDGVRFGHRYDPDTDRHWFGFYRGGNYAWTVYYQNHFWWQEPGRRRWLSYWRDHWWWYGPTGAYYIYIGDQYYQWNPVANGVVLTTPPPQPALPPSPDAPIPGYTPSPLQMGTVVTDSPGASPSGASDLQNVMGGDTLIVSGAPEYHYSADATRMVQVEGKEFSAYLYDLTKQNPAGGHKLIRFLDQGVTGVEFSDTTHGSPLQIVLSVQDAEGAMHKVVLDADGNPLGTPAPEPVGSVTVFGTPGKPGFDAPPDDLPPSTPPLPDGI